MTFDKLVSLISENQQNIIEEGYKEILAKIALLTVAGIGWKFAKDLDHKVNEISKNPEVYQELQKEVEKKKADPVFSKEIMRQYTDKVVNQFYDKIDRSEEGVPVSLQTPKDQVYKNLKTHDEFMKKALKYISQNEITAGKIYNSAYKDVKNLGTIGIGHLIIPDDFKDGTFKPGEYVMKNKQWKSVKISDERAREIFRNDLEEKIQTLRRQFLGFDNYPEALKIVMLDGFFRGDLAGSTTAKALIKKAMQAHFSGKNRVARVMLKSAAKEYLNSREYRKYSSPKAGGMGIALRMRRNAQEIENALTPGYIADFDKLTYK